MSQDNRISINIPDAVLLDVKKHIENATTALKPYLIGLSADERHDLPKMSDKTVAFVDKANSFANSNREFAPNFLDIAELGLDLTAVQKLKPVRDALKILFSDVDDTVMLCGTEAYAGARYYYNSVSYAAKQGNTSAKPIAEDLSKRFPGIKRSKEIKG